MANTTIQLKWSDVTSAPTTLNVGEPAYSNTSHKFFIGDTAGNVLTIGGQYFTDQQGLIFTKTNVAFDTANSAASYANSAFATANSGTSAASWDFDITGFTTALSTVRGGTGLTTVGTADQLLGSNGTTLAYTKVGIANLSATGTASASTYLRGDNSWATITAGVTSAQAAGSLSSFNTGPSSSNYTAQLFAVNGALLSSAQTSACNCNC
jgi:hypothetical protein